MTPYQLDERSKKCSVCGFILRRGAMVCSYHGGVAHQTCAEHPGSRHIDPLALVAALTEPMTTHALHRKTHCPRTTVKRHLDRLLAAGVIRKAGDYWRRK